ncbi:hypothetical protein Tco_1141436 [Tanacetum coccineum]
MMLHIMALLITEAAYITLTEAAKEAIWLKGLAIESGFKLKIVAGIAIGALSKAIRGLRFQHRLNLQSIGWRALDDGDDVIVKLSLDSRCMKLLAKLVRLRLGSSEEGNAWIKA